MQPSAKTADEGKDLRERVGLLADRLNGIGEYYFSRKLREIEQLNREGRAVINLGIGSPDLAPHPDVISVLQKESSRPDVHAYQNYKGVAPLRQAISNWYKRWYGVELNPDTEILPLIGSKEGILHICMTYLNPGDQALVPNPGYPTYRSAVALAGGVALEYSLSREKGWLPDFAELEASLPEFQRQEANGGSPPRPDEGIGRVKLMWVNYPHMPTGQLPTEALFEQLISFGKQFGILICHDNPYSFILNDKPLSLMRTAGAKEVAVELNSLSKSQNMAGWRIGMLVAASKRIEEVLRFKSNMDSGMFLPLQLAAARALDLPQEWYAKLNETYRKRREYVFRILKMLGCAFEERQAGLFVWASVPTEDGDGYTLSDELLREARVFLTPGGIFGHSGNNYLRVSLCCPADQLQAAEERIRQYIEIKSSKHV